MQRTSLLCTCSNMMGAVAHGSLNSIELLTLRVMMLVIFKDSTTERGLVRAIQRDKKMGTVMHFI